MKIKFLLANIFLFVFNVIIYASSVTNVPIERDDESGSYDETEGARSIPVDMYEWVLLGVAIALILGYYFYSKKRSVTNL